jgi:PiT family inorganic phosphate transporter
MTDIALNSSMGDTAHAVRPGLQMATIRNLLMAWVLTLPAAICLSAGLYVLFPNLF